MNARKGDWMQTFTGRPFWPLDPRPEEIAIEDIAHALSLQSRFAGHCAAFYSVAEHSVRVSWIAPVEHKLAALLHDAAEAYVVDVPRPVKPYLTGHKRIESAVARAVEQRYGLAADATEHPDVKWCDEVLLATEARDLMGGERGGPWHLRAEPLSARIVPMTPAEAKAAFLEAFDKLGGAP